MDAGKVRMAIASKVICLVKYEMKLSGTSEDAAYANVMKTDLYALLKDEETGLFLEPKEYVEEAYRLEVKKSVKAMYEFIWVL